MPSSNVTFCKPDLWNAPVVKKLAFVSVFGIVISFRLVQPPNVLLLISASSFGSVSSERTSQPLNASPQIVVIESGRSIFLRDWQLENALPPISVTESGITTSLSVLQLEKIYPGILVMPSSKVAFSMDDPVNAPHQLTLALSSVFGIVISLRLPHPLKICLCIVLSPFGRTTLERLSHLEKASSLIAVTLSGRVIERTFVFSNAFFPITVTGFESISEGIVNSFEDSLYFVIVTVLSSLTMYSKSP